MTDRDDPPRHNLSEAVQAAREKQAARRAEQRAIWQTRVRSYMLRLFVDLRLMQQGPRHDELTAFILECMAERSNNYDLMALIGPFARGLPDAYRQRQQASRSVEAFRSRQDRRKAGWMPPLEPVEAAVPPHDVTPEEGNAMTDQSTDGKDAAQPPKPDPLAQRRALIQAFIQNKATWQADLRLRFDAFMRDYCDRNHPPESVEIAQFLLELVAESCSDYDLIALILPFAERLPYDLEKRREDGRIATEFLRVGQERGKYGLNGRPNDVGER